MARRGIVGVCSRWYKARWLRAVCPNHELVPEHERAIVDSAFDEIWFTSWYMWYLTGLLIAPFFVLQGLLGGAWRLGLFDAGANHLLVLAILLLLVPPIMLGIDLAVMYALRGSFQRKIWDALRRRGIEACLGCGYVLDRSPTPTCPECGRLRG